MRNTIYYYEAFEVFQKLLRMLMTTGFLIIIQDNKCIFVVLFSLFSEGPVLPWAQQHTVCFNEIFRFVKDHIQGQLPVYDEKLFGGMSITVAFCIL